MSTATLTPKRVWLLAGSALLVLALTETIVALTAPLRAPSNADWQAAAASVRAGFRPGDLIVAAPEWSDQVMRLYLGDLVPVATAARLDAERFGRIWEISQRGARHPDATGRVARDERHGALHVRMHEHRPARVSFDFFEHWQDARVSRVAPGGAEAPCPLLPDRHQCLNLSEDQVKPIMAETGFSVHRALLAPPSAAGTMVIEYRDVPMGRELAVASGLHSVWHRRWANGVAKLRILVDGKAMGEDVASNRSGWHVLRLDTAAFSGRNAVVRFEITASEPKYRLLAFAAEARSP